MQLWQAVAREVDSGVRSTCNANARHEVVDTVSRLQLSNNEVQHALTALISQMLSPKVSSGTHFSSSCVPRSCKSCKIGSLTLRYTAGNAVNSMLLHAAPCTAKLCMRRHLSLGHQPKSNVVPSGINPPVLRNLTSTSTGATLFVHLKGRSSSTPCSAVHFRFCEVCGKWASFCNLGHP